MFHAMREFPGEVGERVRSLCLVRTCVVFFFFSSRRRHTRSDRDWSSDVCSSDLGPSVILLHGYAETSRMWTPILPVLGEKFTVIAPDLPGIGESSIPADGLDLKTDRKSVV